MYVCTKYEGYDLGNALSYWFDAKKNQFSFCFFLCAKENLEGLAFKNSVLDDFECVYFRQDVLFAKLLIIEEYDAA